MSIRVDGNKLTLQGKLTFTRTGAETETRIGDVCLEDLLDHDLWPVRECGDGFQSFGNARLTIELLDASEIGVNSLAGAKA